MPLKKSKLPKKTLPKAAPAEKEAPPKKEKKLSASAQAKKIYYVSPKEFTDELFEIGYSSQSRSTKAQLLPPELKPLVGRQSLTIRITSDSARYLGKITQGLNLIGGHMNSTPEIGTKPQLLMSGKRELLYPNRIDDFDKLMIDEQIFSHAFTDFRSLSYTVNLHL